MDCFVSRIEDSRVKDNTENSQLLWGTHQGAFYTVQVDPCVCFHPLSLFFCIIENFKHGVALCGFMKIHSHGQTQSDDFPGFFNLVTVESVNQ